jgi:ATP-dependent helicase/nuclease subunit B
MRAAVGLAPPERRIGEAAHDFVQALGVPDAVVTRARKQDGQPAVPSRFLARLEAFVGAAAWGRVRARGDRLLRLARALDERPAAPPLKRPAPRPDPTLFPRSLSVTEIETLIRDPYAIFARHVLGLDPLEPIATLPGAASRGTLVHDALARFAASFPTELPHSPEDRLLEIGGNLFGPLAQNHPALHAEWWPRFRRMAGAFALWEQLRRADLERVHPEASGAWAIPLSDGTVFTLRARADRIEAGRDGSHAIVDFKTGEPPSPSDIFAGFAPQLTLRPPCSGAAPSGTPGGRRRCRTSSTFTPGATAIPSSPSGSGRRGAKLARSPTSSRSTSAASATSLSASCPARRASPRGPIPASPGPRRPTTISRA